MNQKINSKFKNLIVDESISRAQLNACVEWLEKQEIGYQQLYLIAEHHPGMPDSRIVKSVLSPDDAVLTADRPFHNRLLTENFVSYYIDDSLNITEKTLKGIKPAILPASHSREENYAELSILHNLITPASDRALKKLRTKRRRIRNHFGGYDQLTQLGVTVATRGNLIGIRLQVSGSSAKGIMGSESYISESSEDTGVAALCLALIFTLQLTLHRLDVTLFYDPATIPDPYSLTDSFFNRLKNEFPTLKFLSATKGRHMESLQQKIDALKMNKTNEIVNSPYAHIKQSVLNEYSEK